MNKIYDKVVALFQKQKLTAKQIITIYANLGYTLGASIEGIKDKISQEEIEFRYATNPTLGITMMLQSILMSTWINDIGKTVEDFKKL